MEFLVHITVSIPDDIAEDVVAEERRVGAQLREAGVIRRIWRVPGTTSNVGIWEAFDATELHDALSSLPAFPWAHVEVTPLAVHPLEAVTGDISA
ncbi:MAG TPA: muconolactone Delta-isomerase family protein [Baekduia sp.]|uniref:muconolactone Delta-isomerase n=1 Tax=Baekduia sp. TaxID=2600305 RepID=UPI002BC50A76|nr:muconolactone Delta-isomerase family protein [Baekduia sp.]HMJ36368.1 muconolactone Delta-isomerase family protein [Baekduia sp.]